MPSLLRASLVVAAMSGLAAFGGASADAATATASTDPVPTVTVMERPCSDRLFVGVRGSGEAKPYGRTVERLREDLLRRSGERGTVSAYVDYPATLPAALTSAELDAVLLGRGDTQPQYDRSVAAGVTELTRLLRWSAQTCPRQSVLLLGYSQGAQVVTQALADGAPSSTVTATVLVGSPVHFPGQRVQELDQEVDTAATGLVATSDYLRARALPATSTTHREGLHNLVEQVFALHSGTVSTAQIAQTLQRTDVVLPAAGVARTFSVCREGDLYCDATPALSRILTSQSTYQQEVDRTRPIHTGYLPALLPRTLDEAARLWVARGATATPTTNAAPAPDGAPSPLAGVPAWVVGGLVGLAVVGLGAVAVIVRRRR